MTMVRTQIYLPADLDKKLRKEAAKRKISKAELIRQRLVDASREGLDPEARQRFVDLLTAAQQRAANRPDTGRGFDRNEYYDERADELLSHRHEHPDTRGG